MASATDAHSQSTEEPRQRFSFFGRRSQADTSLPDDYDFDKYGTVNVRFVKGCGGNMREASRRWCATCDWRKDQKIDELVNEPQPHYHMVKRLYPHYIHGKTRGGSYVYIERPGLASIPEMLRQPGVTMPDIVRHYTFVSEYLWSKLDPRVEGKLVSVWDVTGIGIHDLAGETLGLLRATMKVMQTHYPERTEKLFIVNAPAWFTTIWRIISPMIDPNTRKKISILGSKFHAELAEYIGEENLPPEFGGTSSTQLGHSKEELEMERHVNFLSQSSHRAVPNGPSLDRSTQGACAEHTPPYAGTAVPVEDAPPVVPNEPEIAPISETRGNEPSALESSATRAET